MSKIEKYEDIVAWQKARVLAQKIYKLTLSDDFSKDFSLVNQIRSSSGSVMDNIAEGFERDGNKEFRYFLSIAKGSIGETRSQLYRAKDRNFISSTDFEALSNLSLDISKLISGLIKYLKSNILATETKVENKHT
jgi:four helix bundle protein